MSSLVVPFTVPTAPTSRSATLATARRASRSRRPRRTAARRSPTTSTADNGVTWFHPVADVHGESGSRPAGLLNGIPIRVVLRAPEPRRGRRGVAAGQRPPRTVPDAPTGGCRRRRHVPRRSCRSPRRYPDGGAAVDQLRVRIVDRQRCHLGVVVAAGPADAVSPITIVKGLVNGTTYRAGARRERSSAPGRVHHVVGFMLRTVPGARRHDSGCAGQHRRDDHVPTPPGVRRRLPDHQLQVLDRQRRDVDDGSPPRPPRR